MHESARLYTPFALRLYDFVVLWFSNRYAWRCPTDSVLLPFFKDHIGSRAHLDIGVGSGFYLAHSVEKLSSLKTLFLADLNPSTLQKASDRLASGGYKGELQTLEHDAFKPLSSEFHGAFDSISLFYLLHCLPGAFPQKAELVVSQLSPALAPDGTLYGSTILGTGVKHNWIGKILMRTYNKKGIFCNTQDSEGALRDALSKYFDKVEVRVVGMVAIFTASKPRNVARAD